MTNIRRFGGFFLLAALAVQGIPLDGELSVSVHPSLEEARDILLTDIEGIGSGQSYLRLLFWLMLYAGSISLLVFQMPRTSVLVLRENLPLVLLVSLIPLSMLWSENPRIVATNTAHAVGIFAVVVAAVIAYRDKPVTLVRHMSLVLGANVLVHLVSVFVLPEYAINWEDRWRGLWNHPNNLGRIALCALAMNTSYLVLTRRRKRLVHLVMIAGSVVALAGTQSKTATVCAVPAVVGPMFLAWVFRNYGRRGAWQMVLWASLAGTVIAVPVIFFAQELLEAFTGAIGRDASFTGRTDIWSAAIAAIGERPFTGWSFDSHLEIISKSFIRFNNYHNGYLDIMVSGGIPALLLFIWVMARYFVRLKTADPGMVVLFLPLTLSILIYNVFEAGLLASRSTIWIMLIVIVILQTATSTATARVRRGKTSPAAVQSPNFR